MKPQKAIGTLVLLTSLLFGCGKSASSALPNNTPTVPPTATFTATHTPLPTNTPTVSPAATFTATHTPLPTNTPTVSPAAILTALHTPLPIRTSKIYHPVVGYECIDVIGNEGKLIAAYDVLPGTDILSPVDGKITEVGIGYSPSTGATVRFFRITDDRGNEYFLHYLGTPLLVGIDPNISYFNTDIIIKVGMKIAIVEYDENKKISDVFPYPLGLDGIDSDVRCNDLREQ